MVFPKAAIEAKFGDIGSSLHGVDQLRDYIDNAKFSQKFSSSRIDKLARAQSGVAGMDTDFAVRSELPSSLKFGHGKRLAVPESRQQREVRPP